MLEESLLQLRRPARYLGNEWNVVRKDFDKQKLKFAICFPDLYEIGMSHLGLRIIYGLLNSQEGVVCERVFLPDLDMQQVLRSRAVPLYSLESQRPLREFDFIGFCLNYELNYTNILAILDLAGIPFKSQDRPSGLPLVIAGGTCTANPSRKRLACKDNLCSGQPLLQMGEGYPRSFQKCGRDRTYDK